APHAQTHESLSLSLTFANQDSQGIIAPSSSKRSKKPIIKPWYEYLNIIDAFKLGGYHTRAISNQEPVSLFGNAAATILKRADEVSFVNINDKMSTTKFDESIIEILKNEREKAIQEQTEQKEQESHSADENTQEQNIESNSTQSLKPTFYALHLMGNHAKYYNRYPSEFAHFTPKDMLCQEDNSPQKSANIEENMHYDNSVLYGDYILS
ncbi:sulfatase-like hydrolase/transferase, partial [Helicobacter sp. MIT 21-1697]|uniref:sulfatase-like hydrolase/transferase n=1 Tax=Helicobacter sp. MIT 21-1697 TaxID=2993733 RepID=UPI00224AE4C0